MARKNNKKDQKALQLAAMAPSDPRFLRPDAGNVMVSIDGQDQGSLLRHAKGEVLDAGTDAGAISGKIGALAPVQIEIQKRVSRVYRAQDCLDWMLKNKTITDLEFAAGRRFQKYHELSNRYPLRSVSFEQTGGRMTREDFLSAQINASNKVDEIAAILGGPNVVAVRALIDIVCKGVSFDTMALYTGIGKHYWRGSLVTALGVLASYFEKGKRKQKVIK